MRTLVSSMVVVFLCVVQVGFLATQQLQSLLFVLIAAVISRASGVVAQGPVSELIEENEATTVHVDL